MTYGYRKRKVKQAKNHIDVLHITTIYQRCSNSTDVLPPLVDQTSCSWIELLTGFLFFFLPLLVSVSDLCSHYLLIVLLFSVCVVVLAYIGGGGMEGNWVKGHRCSGARLVHDLVLLRQTLGGLSGEMFLFSLSAAFELQHV